MQRMKAALAAVLIAVTGVVALAAAPPASAAPPTTDLKISEFRLRGPSGANDEFIEITNVGPAHTVAGAGTGYAVAASDGVARCVIPNGTTIPSGGHFLCVNSFAYSLASYPAGPGTTATGDATYTSDIPDNAGIALFGSSQPVEFTLDHRIDAVGSTSEANTLYKEGTGYPALTPFSIDYSFYRNLSTPSITNAHVVTSPTPGVPQDTDVNATDFVFVDTNGTSAGAGQRLGAPGPENALSPIAHGGVDIDLIDDCVAESAAPNAVRTETSDPANNSTFGTVTYNRVITNTTDEPITRLRLRMADVRTFPAPSGISDTRPRTSTAGTVDTNDGACSGGISTVPVAGTTLEQPPSQPNGSGFNGTWSVGTVSTATPLDPGKSITVRLLSGIQQTGDTAIRIIPEVTTEAAYEAPVPVCLGTDLVGGRNACFPPAPVITTNPASDTVTVGETATFTAAATGSTSVRWERSTDGQAWTTIDGETGTTLAFTATIADDGTRYRAVFVGTDAAETATTAATLTVEQRATGLELTVDPTDPVRGDDVTLTATLTPATATGSVEVVIPGVGTEEATVAAGKAVVTFEDLAVGSYTATATYSGDGEHATANDVLDLDVTAIATEVTVEVDPATSQWGDEVNFTATVAPEGATGTVQFSVDGSDVGQPVAVVDGEAVSAPVTTLAVGTRTIGAAYSGDDDHAPGTGDTTTVVEQRATTTELTADPAAPAFGQPVTLTAEVGPATATGTVQFAVDGSDVGDPVTVVDGQAVGAPLTDLAVGGRTVTATYSGDEQHAGSDDEITVTVGRKATSTEITAVRPESPVEGDELQLDVTVTPAPAGGTVTLSVDGDDVGTPVAVDTQTGTATLVLADAPAGELALKAVYSGDDTHLGSEDATTVTVITDNASFVRRAYRVVLGRAPEAGGVAYWSGVLDAGGSRERVTDGMARQVEGRRKLVQDAYVAFLDRPADTAGRDYWVGRLASGLGAEDLGVQLAASPEAKAGAGGTNADLVELLYRAHIGRTGDEAGVAYWVGRLDAATTENGRRAVVRAFGRSAEVTRAAVGAAVATACAPGTEVPTDAAYGQWFAATGRDRVRLAGLVLARHCPGPIVD